MPTPHACAPTLLRSLRSAALGRDFDTLLQRVAAEQPSRIGRLVFAVNNSAAIVAVAQARGMHAEDAAPFQVRPALLLPPPPQPFEPRVAWLQL